MLTKAETARFKLPTDATGRVRTAHNFVEDATFPFPPELLQSARIKAVLELVTDKYLFYLLAAPPVCQESIYHKINHTNDVVRAMIELYEPNNEFTLEDAVCLALAHDIARPIQGALFNRYSDTHTGIDHGVIGAQVYAAAFPEDTLVYQGIHDHNKLCPTFQESWVYAIQDADRIAIWRRIFDRAAAESYRNGEGKTVSQPVLLAFSTQKLVDKKYVQTEADDWICSLAWMWDLHFQKARRIVAADHWPERIAKYICTHFEPEPYQVGLLKQGVRNWYQRYDLVQEFGEPDFNIAVP